MRKTWLALMGGAERAYRDVGGHKNEQNPADPYMTENELGSSMTVVSRKCGKAVTHQMMLT
jgi:hypothetical protein